jgi:GT2 family glycosyltransferase
MDSVRIGEIVTGETMTAHRVLIAVPFYKNERLVDLVVGSLIRCAADLAEIGADVVFYVDSPDYPALRDALAAVLPRAEAAFSCRVVTNPENLGFVRTMNLAVAEAVAKRCDLLLLNSDTQVEPGALAEMVRVMRLDHMIGFVNPRSNNATIATLPLQTVPPDRPASLAAFKALAARLPPVSYAPTSVGFCMLINWRVLAEFGGFDTIYGKGYNEENDLVMRAGRCGFRAVLANHAFVWHEGEESFSRASVDRSVLEPINRAILDQRYPEYAGHTLAHYDAPETLAERLMAMLLPDAEGKLDVAFDFSSFRAAHNGTFVAGRQLLAAASKVWDDAFRLHVICTPQVYAFHDYAALGIPREHPHGGKRFAAVFRVGQPYDWNVVERMIVSGAVLGVYMLDTISIDCPQLTSQHLYNMWQFTLDHVDLLVTQSHQTQAHFLARFAVPANTARLVSLHSLDLADYVLPVAPDTARLLDRKGQRILVLGNHFHHKFLARTANALAAAYPDRMIVALGQAAAEAGEPIDPMEVPALDRAANIQGISVGGLSDAEVGLQYAASDVVVFPSHAEGFGFPVLNALASRRPVLLRRLPVFEELWQALGGPPNIHFYDSTAELIGLLAELPRWVEWEAPGGNGGERTAREIRVALEKALGEADYPRIVRRIRAVQMTSGFMSKGGANPDDTEAAQVAQFVASRLESVLRRVLSIKAVYATSRIAFRVARQLRRWLSGREN